MLGRSDIGLYEVARSAGGLPGFSNLHHMRLIPLHSFEIAFISISACCWSIILEIQQKSIQGCCLLAQFLVFRVVFLITVCRTLVDLENRFFIVVRAV